MKQASMLDSGDNNLIKNIYHVIGQKNLEFLRNVQNVVHSRKMETQAQTLSR